MYMLAFSSMSAPMFFFISASKGQIGHFLDFLAHLSRRLIGELLGYVGLRRPSVCRPHSLNIFSSETSGPMKVKFHMELLEDGGTKVCSNGPGRKTKMTAMPIYGKNLNKSSSSEPKGR